MALKPLLKTKVDELFLLWLSEPETQKLLHSSLSQVIRGEPVTKPANQLSALVKPGNGSSGRQQAPKSPRIRPSSPPHFPTNVPSPRNRARHSPNTVIARDNTAVQPQQQQQQILPLQPAREQVVIGSRDGSAQGETEDQSQSFLKKKEEELRQKRERERQTAEARSKQAVDATFTVSPPAAVTVAKVATATPAVATVSKLEFVAVTTVTSPTETVSTSLITPPVRTAVTTTTTSVANKIPKTVAAATVPPVLTTGTYQPARPVPGANANIPQFYFPLGAPTPGATDVEETALKKIREEFEKLDDGKMGKNALGPVVKALGLPVYWKFPFFNFAGGDRTGQVTLQMVLDTYKRLVSSCRDESSQFLRLIAKPGRQFIEFDDFLPLIQDVVDSHPGLTFLQDAPEFHSRYVQTVISRIFYCVNRSWSGRIVLAELRRSNLLQTIRRLDQEDDINQITDFFSYEHFYVIYCKFWELDRDHDLLIAKDDLSRHNDHAISTRVIDRIFSGAVTRNLVDGKLSYRDFVWFLISEEDKRHPRSVEYWFRCMDLDGDGIISMYEMEFFYEEQVEKMEMLGIETLPFQDCLCQMLDMVQPKEDGRIRLQDLKSCSLTPIFFDTFINLDKYLEHEQKDPFSSIRDQDSTEPEPSDWERYAAEEYELLVAEEGATDAQHDDVMYEDDFEPEHDSSPAVTGDGPNRTSNIDLGSTQQSAKKSASAGTTPARSSAGSLPQQTNKDDIYDFSDVQY